MISLRTLATCSALLLAPFAAHAADPAPAKPSAGAIDPDAMAALTKLGADLRSHDTFDVKADVTTEDVLSSGQKLQYAGTVAIQARRPDRFKISMVSDLRARDIYYDGKAVTLYSPRLGFYASFDAPPTIGETVNRARDNYGIEMPLADLFSWGLDPTLEARVTSAMLVRPEHIDGRLCNHYAFRQANVDWQVWIAQDAPAVPCKLVITNKADPSMPQYTAVLHWSFPASIADGTFTFAPPANAKKITFAKFGK